MIELSGIKLRRVCSCTDQDRDPTIEIDVLEQIFDVIRLGVSEARTTDAVDESIGVYKQDQDNARRRTWNPFFWLAWAGRRIGPVGGRLFRPPLARFVKTSPR